MVRSLRSMRQDRSLRRRKGRKGIRSRRSRRRRRGGSNGITRRKIEGKASRRSKRSKRPSRKRKTRGGADMTSALMGTVARRKAKEIEIKAKEKAEAERKRNAAIAVFGEVYGEYFVEFYEIYHQREVKGYEDGDETLKLLVGILKIYPPILRLIESIYARDPDPGTDQIAHFYVTCCVALQSIKSEAAGRQQPARGGLDDEIEVARTFLTHNPNLQQELDALVVTLAAKAGGVDVDRARAQFAQEQDAARTRKNERCANKAAENFEAEDYGNLDICEEYVKDCHGSEALEQFKKMRVEQKVNTVGKFCRNIYETGMTSQ